MNCELQIDFFRKILKDLYISSCIVTNPYIEMSSNIDLGLRAELYKVKNYAEYFKNTFQEVADKTVYRFYDEYDYHYIFLCLSPEKKSYLFVGPYLKELPGKDKILQKIGDAPNREEQFAIFERHYSNLPIVEDENYLLTMTNTLACQLWGDKSNFSLEYIDYSIPDKHKPVEYISLPHNNEESTISLAMLEQNYENERILMSAVSSGKLHKLVAVSSSVSNNGTQIRLSDTLRDRKNYLIILKTLLRKAAENGEVHPFHIDKLSDHYAQKIEDIRTIKQGMILQNDMIRDFCTLVKKHSLKKYSYYVSRVITMVQYDLTADLGLKKLAEELNVNASYLSELFHREYGTTLTDFINKERINHGIHLLKSTRKSVQEIATECGIPDSSYFIKLFKKQTGITPKQFRTSLGKE